MELTATIDEQDYTIYLEKVHDLSIPIRFDDKQLAAFGTSPARKGAYEAGEFVGNVANGGSCNCETLHITPHLNGTHTESMGHITTDAMTIHGVIKNGFMPATLISITPTPASECDESYNVELRESDLLITKAAIANAIDQTPRAFLSALIIRTLPNESDKTTRNYNETLPPFFSSNAMRYIGELGVQHILVDTPSVDRLDDEGKLGNHRLFWSGENPSQKTITELVYAADNVADGTYMLDLQVAPIMSDAAPSKPTLYEVQKL